MTSLPLEPLSALTTEQLDELERLLASPRPRSRGRPWALPLRQRILIACTSLRTNLTVRELATVFSVSRSQAQRVVAHVTAHLARLFATPPSRDRRWSWVVDGTLVPTRDHVCAAKSKTTAGRVMPSS